MSIVFMFMNCDSLLNSIIKYASQSVIGLGWVNLMGKGITFPLFLRALYHQYLFWPRVNCSVTGTRTQPPILSDLSSSSRGYILET